MKTCVFFGHRDMNCQQYREKLKQILTDLIKYEGFTQFYSGGRGAFDNLCAETIAELKKSYPQIKNTLVFSYLPPSNTDFSLSPIYTDTLYALERYVPPRYAILETNKAMVDKADCLVVGITREWGGVWQAVEYAKRKKKRIINVCEENA